MFDRGHVRPNILLAYPVMLSMLGQVMTGVADSIMVGWIGATPLAASSFSNTFFSITLLFGIGISYAITPLVAHASGSGNRVEVSHVLRHGMLINLITAALLTGFLFLMMPWMYEMGQPSEVVELAIPYLVVVAPSIIPTMIFQTYRQFGEGLQHTRMAMVIVILSNLLNIILNYLLIYGKFGLPEMGLLGAGWATLISRCCMGLAMALYIFYGRSFKLYRHGFKTGNYALARIKSMLHIGVPAGAQFIFEAGAFGFSSIMMGWLGTVPLAAHQIALNLATISYMITSGMGAAATIRIGHFFGKGDVQNLRSSGFTMFWMAAALMLFWAIIFIAGQNLLPTIYISDPAVINVSAGLLVVGAFFQLSDGIQVVATGALRGLQDVKIPGLLIFAAYWILALPVGYWLTFHRGWGPQGIWMGLLIGLTLSALATVWRFNRLSSELNRR